MFFNILKREFILYLRKLWPFAVAVVSTAALAAVVIAFDKNPVEMTGTVTFIGLYVIASITLLVASFAAGYSSLFCSLGEGETTTNLLWTKLLSAVLWTLAVLFFVFTGTFVFAWKWALQVIAAVFEDWLYPVEFIIFLAIMMPFILLFPAAGKTVNARTKRRFYRVLTVAGEVFFGLLTFVMLVWEVQLLIHSPSTDMRLLWIIMCSLLAFCACVNVACSLLIAHLLKEKKL